MNEIVLHVPDDVLEEAAIAAAEGGVSVNQLMVALVAEGLDRRRARTALRERMPRASVPAALDIFDGAPDVPPEAGDTISRGSISGADLLASIRSRIEPLGGVDLDLPERTPPREPPGFDS